jgi:hypothetical protein
VLLEVPVLAIIGPKALRGLLDVGVLQGNKQWPVLCAAPLLGDDRSAEPVVFQESELLSYIH